jgi:tetratricopeptide (TPR) repeat protein
LIREKRITEARPLLDLLAAEEPRDLHVWSLRLVAARQLEDPARIARARDALELAIPSLELDDVETLFRPIRNQFGSAREIEAASRIYRGGDLAGGAAAMERLSHDPLIENGKIFILQEVAQVQLGAGQIDKAARLLEKQIDERKFPTATAWELMADVANARGDAAGELSALQHAERLLPSASVYFKLAQLARQRGDEGVSRQFLSRSRLIDSRQLLRAGQIDDARRRIRDAVELDPRHADAWYLLGEINRRLQRGSEARSAFRRCLELDENHGRAREALDQLATAREPS